MKDPLNYALKLLSIKDYLECELNEKISNKFDKLIAIDVISKLREYGYINDERYIKNYISHRLRLGYGEYYISNKLYDKGMKVTIDDILNVAYEEEIDIDSKIVKHAEKFLIRNDEDREKLYYKCITNLKNRGFNISSIFRLVSREEFLR